MRILHTSDWHLGQHFMGKSREAEHQALIAWLLEQVQAHAVDAVLIAGDIFDTGAPPSYARALYSQLVARLHAAGVALLLLGGNHDSVSVLEENHALLACLNTTVIAAVGAVDAHVVTLPARTGEPGCIVCALPFIRARDVVQSQAGQTAQEKQQALQSAIQATYQAVHAQALLLQAQLQASLGRRLPIIATGHLTTVGASSNESVREIYVGALEAFPTNAFPAADYIALGHIHKPQKVGGFEHIRYCGSPIALGFDEARQSKQVLLVDLGEPGLEAVTALTVPVFQPLAAVSASLAGLPPLLQSAASAGTAQRPVWLEVTVQDDDYLNDLAARVEALLQGLPLETLRIKRQRGPQAAQLTAQGSESLDELTPDEVFARRLAEETLTPELQAALSERYRGVLARLTAAAEGHAQ
ncbi:exonuclease subunit SbcD [Pantoea sp. 18069]|uniref:exonuclease subunit SbcD n=1 Tax=Pantoea sp. 18069 TaxID=2681415 RepID=UPI0013596A46|nr:exonuclease subunit SbcD [Pantoea sp. 18069]